MYMISFNTYANNKLMSLWDTFEEFEENNESNPFWNKYKVVT